MNMINVIIRIILTLAVILFLIIGWALGPYLRPEVPLDAPIVSIFLGNNGAVDWTRDLLLLARALFGLSVALYIFMPVLSFFGNFELRVLRRDLCLLILGLSIIAWIGALVYHFFFVL